MTLARPIAAFIVAVASMAATIAPADAGGAGEIAARWGYNPTGFGR